MSKRQTFLLITFVVLGIFAFGNTKAGPADNVSGWAWSENIGWISFNNTSGGGATNYGVNIAPDGVFSGYAWSENIGWISFNRSDTGAPPGSPDYGTHLAEVDLDTGDVSGWARALTYNGGWSGWIKLRGPTYGVSINRDTGEFYGWAWSNQVVGWISFNCANPESGNVCLVSDYKTMIITELFNNPPSATNLLVTEGDYCPPPLAKPPPIILSWEFSDPDAGDSQSAYRVQIDNNSDFSSPEIDSGKILSSSNSYAPINLSYNTTYYWQVMVWDSSDSSSGWIVGPVFSTPIHAYPGTDFDWTPQSPSVDELVQFTDQTTYYNGGASWSWDFGDGGTSSLQNPTHSYSSAGTHDVNLDACDGIGCCFITKQITVSLPLPEWKEIPPF